MTHAVYSLELVEIICDRIANGESLRSILSSRDDYTAMSTFLRWMALSDGGDEDFAGASDHYARAMAQRADYMVEQTRCRNTCAGRSRKHRRRSRRSGGSSRARS